MTALVGSVYKDRKLDSSTQQSQVRHGSDEPGLMIEPQLAPGPEGPIQSADRSTATVVGVDQSFSKTWFEADPSCSVNRNEKDDDDECQRQRSLAAGKGAPEKRNPLN